MAAYEDQQCIDCGVFFGLPLGFTAYRRGDKRSFFCPNGHPMCYGESELDRTRRERDRLKQQNARLQEEADAAGKSADAARERAAKFEAATLRLKKRAAAGTCPCCNRTFGDMARHMKTKHPAFRAEGVVVPIKSA